jgi:hypothetical protein
MGGNRVSILFGGSVPFVLRRKDDYWGLVGECYVEGIMRGAAVQEWKLGKLTAKTFHLR